MLEGKPDKFDENVGLLWNVSMKHEPFDCIDINIAKTEIGQLQVNFILSYIKK